MQERPPRIVTPDVVALRPFGREDFSRLIAWIGSPESLFEWTGSSFDYPLDHHQLERHLDELPAPQLDRRLFTAVEERTGEAVGHIELERIDVQRRSATVCRLVVAPDGRNRGIGTAIMQALLGKAFDELGLHRVELRTFDSNLAVGFHEQLGFVREGLLRDVAPAREGYRSAIVMSLLEPEWRSAAALGLLPALGLGRAAGG
jgi:RimJ/RimL family protein N-acetyltransferase